MTPFGSSKLQPVYVVGVGACTSIGYNAASTAAAVRSGINSFHEHPYMVDRAGEKMIVARVKALPPEMGLAERVKILAAAAALEALRPLREQRFGGEARMPVTVGLPAPRPSTASDNTAAFSDGFSRMKSRIGFTELSTFSTGHSAALMALQNGFVEIQEGRADLFLIGGADSYLDADTLEWLDETEQLHSEENTWGFIPGEAAGFALLASERAAQRWGLSPLLRVVAAATSIETNLIRTNTVCTGKGLTTSVKQTLRALPAEEKVHYTICDMNGERYRADELAFTITRTSNRFVDATNFLSPADCWGDIGAASGGSFLSLSIAAKRKDYAHGTLTLLWTSSEGGERSSVLTSEGI